MAGVRLQYLQGDDERACVCGHQQKADEQVGAGQGQQHQAGGGVQLRMSDSSLRIVWIGNKMTHILVSQF